MTQPLDQLLLATEEQAYQKPQVWKLYVSHLLSTFGDALWQFAVPVLFMTVWTDTLLPGSLFNFIVNIITAFIFPNIGALVDRTPRKTLMAISIFGEAISMIVAALCFWPLMIVLPDESNQEEWAPRPLTPAIAACYVLIVLCSTATEIFMQAGTIALENIWPPALVRKEYDIDGKRLAECNSTMTSIAQFSLLAGPAAFGIVVQLASGGIGTTQKVQYAVLMIITWNVLCVPFEWFTLASLCRDHPELSHLDSKKAKEPKPFFKELAGGWKTFVSHPFSLPSVSGVLLSFTVLNSSPVSTAWMVWAGVPLGILGFLRGGAAVSGLLGGWTYRWLYKCSNSSPERAALYGICLFAALLLPCGGAMRIFGSTTIGAWFLLLTITASRFPLFWFKPAQTQLTQEYVAADIRGKFQGTNKSLNKVFTVGIAAVGIVCNKPMNFPVLVYMSVSAVNLSALFYLVWYFRDPTARQRLASGESAPLAKDTA